MKPVEIVYEDREGRWRRTMEAVNLIKIYCKHKCKCHNVYSLKLLYDNQKNFLK
jgi:hypothetical protein